MIIEETKQELKTSSEFENSDIKLNDNAAPLLISMLTEKLYRNPLKTAMIELFSNGRDAHRLNNNLDRPVEITLPNKFNEYFIIRDYGVSMNHEIVMKVYNEVGNSTKRDSNDDIGGFGIGKMSAVAYGSKCMQITTFLNGERREYFMHLQSGKGGIKFIKKEPTTEENGVEIKFKVLQHNIVDCHNYARTIYSFCSPLPIVKGISDFKFETYEYLMKEDTWGLISQGYTSKCFVTINGLRFPVDIESLGTLTDDQKILLNTSLVMHFNVGDLDVVPDRCNLLYNEKVNNNIKKRLDEILQHLDSLTSEKFSGCHNLWEAKCLYYELFGTHGSSGNAIGKVLGKDYQVNWQNNKINTFHFTNTIDGVNIIKYNYKYNHRLERDVLKRSNVERILPNSDCDIYINDIGINTRKGIQRRVTTLLEETKEDENKDSESPIFIVHFETEKAKKDFYASEFSCIPTKNISQVKETKRKISYNCRSLKGGKKAFIFNPEAYDTQVDSTSWDIIDVNLEEGGIYVEIDRFRWKEMTTFRLTAIIRSCIDFDYIDEDEIIFGFKPSLAKKIKNNNNWISLDDYIKSKIKENYNSDDLTYYKSCAKTCFSTNFRYDFEFIESLKEIGNELINKIHVNLDEINRATKKWEEIKSLSCFNESEIKTDFNKVPCLEKIVKEFYERYPLLLSYKNRGYSSRVQEQEIPLIQEYMELINEKNLTSETKLAL